MESSTDTCVRIEANGARKDVIYVKGTWFPTRFNLSITDGLRAWICNASEQNVADRATQWDQSISEYLEDAQRYLSHQQEGSVYTFASAGNGQMRLSWTLEKQGTKLEWRWKCEKAPNDQRVTMDILDFLLDANTRLSEEVVRKTRSFERMKGEAEKCLAQSEKLKNEKIEFETSIYAKFVAVLNSKKEKLRDLRERCLRSESMTKKDTADECAHSEEETDRESDFSDNKQSSDGPTYSGPKNYDGTSLASSGKVRENKSERHRLIKEAADSDSTELLEDEEMPKISAGGEPSSSAAALLAGSNYTSAPKKRHRP